MIVLAGKNNIAVEALSFVQREYDGEIAVVCNSTDNGIHGFQRSLKKEAKDRNIPIISLADAYRESSLFVSLEFDKIIRPDHFLSSDYYNIHFSLLPKYKGMYTSVWPILNNEEITGVTLHKIDQGIDTGDIVQRTEIEINQEDRARDLYRKYISNGINLFREQFQSIISGELIFCPQESDHASYYSKSSINFRNFNIDLIKTAHEIKKQIYAFSFREYQLPIIFGRKIAEAKILDKKSAAKPGSILKESEDHCDISTIDFDLRLYFDRISRLQEFASCDSVKAKQLLTGLCGVHDRNEQGWSPIIVAAYHGNIEVVDFLVNSGADLNDVNNNGTSVLMYAKDYCLKNNDRTLFEFLREKGADINKTDYSGRSVTDYLQSAESDFLGI